MKVIKLQREHLEVTYFNGKADILAKKNNIV
jgi:hypothetical protein